VASIRQEVGIQDRIDQRKGMISSMNDCNVLRFVLEVRVEKSGFPQVPFPHSMDGKVHFLDCLGTLGWKSLFVVDQRDPSDVGGEA